MIRLISVQVSFFDELFIASLYSPSISNHPFHRLQPAMAPSAVPSQREDADVRTNNEQNSHETAQKSNDGQFFDDVHFLGDKEGKVIIRSPPKFKTLEEERDYQKQHLAAAFRVFAKQGFDEGVAGHISLRDPVNPGKGYLQSLVFKY